MTAQKTIEKMRKDTRVMGVDVDEDGVWVWLLDEYATADGEKLIHEDTATAAMSELRSVAKAGGCSARRARRRNE